VGSHRVRLRARGGTDEDRQEVFRRAVFNVLASNNDDHTKNHSFLMERTGRWSLAPAYDIVYAYNASNHWLARHQMSIEGKFEGITRRDLLIFGDRFGVPDIRGVLDQIEDTVAHWGRYAREAGLSSERTEEIGRRLQVVSRESA
jgi:serine/threonine-protein kinase HipA